MPRYAIYFVPEANSALYEFGASVLRYDSIAACDRAPPSHPYFQQAEVSDISAEPRRYGFHATLKAPFSLAEGQSEADLLAHARQVLSRRAIVSVGRLAVVDLGSFVALRPVAEAREIGALADHCVTAFEAFRAPLSIADRTRRLKSPLTDRQIGNLDRWGYPYVFEDFRFHMTLTGALEPGERQAPLAALRDLYGGIDTPVAIDSVCVARQIDRDARFVVLERFPLG